MTRKGARWSLAALLCVSQLACRSMLESSEARYVDEQPQAPEAGSRSQPEDDGGRPYVPEAGEAGMDAMTMMDGDAGGGCESHAQCAAQADGCQVGTCDPADAACRFTVARDCEPCGSTSASVCVAGACLQDGRLYESSLDGDTLDDEWTSVQRPWTLTDEDRYAGRRSAMSGRIGHDAASQLVLTVEDVPEQSVVAFWLRVSSEAGHDRLEFLIGDAFVDAWSGDVGWERVEYPVQARGRVTFAFRYVKDIAGAAGEDRAFIDEVAIYRACP